MAGSSLLVVVNSLRLSRLPDPEPEHAPERLLGEPESARHGFHVPAMASPAIEQR